MYLYCNYSTFVSPVFYIKKNNGCTRIFLKLIGIQHIIPIKYAYKNVTNSLIKEIIIQSLIDIQHI